MQGSGEGEELNDVDGGDREEESVGGVWGGEEGGWSGGGEKTGAAGPAPSHTATAQSYRASDGE